MKDESVMENTIRMVRLEDVAKLISGRTPDRDRPEYYAESGTPWIKIENLDQGFIDSASEYLSPAGREKVNLIPPQSILFSIVGTVGKVGITGVEAAMNQQIVALVFDESKVLPRYGYYCLRHFASEIRDMADQTTMPIINRKTLGQYRIPVPQSLEIQKTIADELGILETYIQNADRRCQVLGQFEQELFVRWFGEYETAGEKLPLRAWLAEPVTAGIPKADDPENDFPCVRSSHFERPYLVDKVKQQWKTAQTDAPDVDNRYRLKNKDVLLYNGKVLLVDGLEENLPVYGDRSILILRTEPGQLLPEVLAAWLAQPGMQQILYGVRKEGDTRKRSIRIGELERLEAPVFPMERQKAFRDVLEKCMEIFHSLDLEKEKGVETLQLLAQQYFERKQILPERAVSEEKEAEDARLAVSARLLLAALCCWVPVGESLGNYTRRRRDIFQRVLPVFQPTAAAFAGPDGQEDYLLVRDYMTYHSENLYLQWETPLDLYRSLLARYRNGNLTDAHIAYTWETRQLTDREWKTEDIIEMAREGMRLLLDFSGLEEGRILLGV